MNIFGRIKVKETVRISKKDLYKMLDENQHMQKQITELQTDNTRLLLENRALKDVHPEQDDGGENDFPEQWTRFRSGTDDR